MKHGFCIKTYRYYDEVPEVMNESALYAEHFYTEDGVLIHDRFYLEDERSELCETKYYDDGWPLSKVVKETDFRTEEFFRYDEYGYTGSLVRMHIDGGNDWEIETHNIMTDKKDDGKGNCIKTIDTFDSKYRKLSTFKAIYDHYNLVDLEHYENGKRDFCKKAAYKGFARKKVDVSVFYPDDRDEEISIIISTFDDKGRLTAEFRLPGESHTYSYIDNEDGNWVHKTSWRENGEIEYVEIRKEESYEYEDD